MTDPFAALRPLLPLSTQNARIYDAAGITISTIVNGASFVGDCARAAALAHCANCHDELVDALAGVIRIADRKTIEFDAARAALAKAMGSDPHGEMLDRAEIDSGDTP